jgi:hypothetical protein
MRRFAESTINEARHQPRAGQLVACAVRPHINRVRSGHALPTRHEH